MDMKAMIIEDSPDTREMLKFILTSQEELEVVAVTSGEEAFTHLKNSFLPDFIILDINLPGMDGADILYKLHKNKQWKKITVFPYSSLWKQETLKPYEEDLDIVKKWKKAERVRYEDDPRSINFVEGKAAGDENTTIINPRLIITIATFLKRKNVEISPSLKNLTLHCFDVLEEHRKK